MPKVVSQARQDMRALSPPRPSRAPGSRSVWSDSLSLSPDPNPLIFQGPIRGLAKFLLHRVSFCRPWSCLSPPYHHPDISLFPQTFSPWALRLAAHHAHPPLPRRAASSSTLHPGTGLCVAWACNPDHNRCWTEAHSVTERRQASSKADSSSVCVAIWHKNSAHLGHRTFDDSCLVQLAPTLPGGHLCS